MQSTTPRSDVPAPARSSNDALIAANLCAIVAKRHLLFPPHHRRRISLAVASLAEQKSARTGNILGVAGVTFGLATMAADMSLAGAVPAAFEQVVSQGGCAAYRALAVLRRLTIVFPSSPRVSSAAWAGPWVRRCHRRWDPWSSPKR